MDSAPDMNRTGSDGNTSADHASSAAKVKFFAFFCGFFYKYLRIYFRMQFFRKNFYK